MNTELFIAKRLFSDKKAKSGFSRPIISIAVIGIALGLAVMIISVAVITGFKKEIRNKVTGFSSHIQITNYDNNSSYETHPIKKTQTFYPELANYTGIQHIQSFAIKAGIIKTRENFQGAVMKGVGNDFDWSFFKNSLVEGNIFKVNDSTKTNKAIISKVIASQLNLSIGDDFRMYFAQNPPRVRKFIVHGIYETSLVEFDKTYILVDIGHIQKLNDWSKDEISGFEITIENFDDLEIYTEVIADLVGYNYEENGDFLMVSNIKEKHIQIFDWLNLQDLNVWIILILMLLVAGINMISGLLILILERTNMIGILKAMGTENFSIRLIFLYVSGLLISKGLLIGNIIGLGICAIQHFFKIFKLDQSSYFLDTVPINFNMTHILSLNIGTLLLTIVMLLLPSYIIARISPDKSIKFE